MQVELELNAAQLRTIGDEWEIVRAGQPKAGECFLSALGGHILQSSNDCSEIAIIVRRKWEWPAWIKPGTWLAMDEDGSWYCYEGRPHLVSGSWDGSNSVRLDSNILDWTPPPTPADWRMFLIQKPAE